MAGRGGGEVAEEKSYDDTASAELARAFLLLVEKHAQQGGEETGLDLGQSLQGEMCRTKRF